MSYATDGSYRAREGWHSARLSLDLGRLEPRFDHWPDAFEKVLTIVFRNVFAVVFESVCGTVVEQSWQEERCTRGGRA